MREGTVLASSTFDRFLDHPEDRITERWGREVAEIIHSYQDATLLEIGSGSFLGLPLFSHQSTAVYQIDPAPTLPAGAARANEQDIAVASVQGLAQHLPVTPDSIDLLYISAAAGGKFCPAPFRLTASDVFPVLRAGGDLLITGGLLRDQTPEEAVEYLYLEPVADQFTATKPSERALYLQDYKKTVVPVLDRTDVSSCEKLRFTGPTEMIELQQDRGTTAVDADYTVPVTETVSAEIERLQQEEVVGYCDTAASAYKTFTTSDACVRQVALQDRTIRYVDIPLIGHPYDKQEDPDLFSYLSFITDHPMEYDR